jgi:hypothetical protein
VKFLTDKGILCHRVRESMSRRPRARDVGRERASADTCLGNCGSLGLLTAS